MRENNHIGREPRARLDSVRVVRRDRTGRAELVELAGERRKRLRGWDFKIIVGRTLGWNVLKSSRFDVARAGSAFVFHGTGFGHGLGLCQAGAHRMASRGASYREIMDVANWDRSVVTNVPGQSGQPESPYYGNLLPLWDRGEYFPMVYSRARVDHEREFKSR